MIPTTYTVTGPVSVEQFEQDDYGSYNDDSFEVAPDRELVNAIRAHEYMRDDLGQYIDIDAVLSVTLDVKMVQRKLQSIATVTCERPLTDDEKDQLIDELSGQYSDGWGEGFEQQDIRYGDGYVNVHFWTWEMDDSEYVLEEVK